jgi:hypothetical protein
MSNTLPFSNDFQVIVSYCLKRLGSKKEKWRRVLKVIQEINCRLYS